MITYGQAKAAALYSNSSFDTARDMGIGWMFEVSSAPDETPFFMVKKDGEIITDILDFVEEYMTLEKREDILLDFETGIPRAGEE